MEGQPHMAVILGRQWTGKARALFVSSLNDLPIGWGRLPNSPKFRNGAPKVVGARDKGVEYTSL